MRSPVMNLDSPAFYVRQQPWILPSLLLREWSVSLSKLFRFISAVDEVHRETTKMEVVVLTVATACHSILRLLKITLSVPSLRMVRGEFLMDCDSDDTPTNVSLACDSRFLITGLV
ncbi:hypothetical protein D5086_024427 [Populus alba]|uniref:Uncharacterized protein n=1 Tax=Populus alba TaxID=43335 RepID=A0ACC4B5W7_POPAL